MNYERTWDRAAFDSVQLAPAELHDITSTAGRFSALMPSGGRASGDAARTSFHLSLKRFLDVAIAASLLILLLPLLAGIALTIRIVDGNPVIYTQLRYGRHGRQFKIFKFRTMSVAESATSFTQARVNDPRVSTLGGFLRRTSLDELPQLFNVLVGDMSLVGPRPHALAMEEEIFRRHPYARCRLDMRPGVTGLAQVKGFRGPTNTDEALMQRLEADIAYTTDWSLWRDIVILVKTPFAVLRQNAH